MLMGRQQAGAGRLLGRGAPGHLGHSRWWGPPGPLLSAAAQNPPREAVSGPVPRHAAWGTMTEARSYGSRESRAQRPTLPSPGLGARRQLAFLRTHWRTGPDVGMSWRERASPGPGHRWAPHHTGPRTRPEQARERQPGLENRGAARSQQPITLGSGEAWGLDTGAGERLGRVHSPPFPPSRCSVSRPAAAAPDSESRSRPRPHRPQLGPSRKWGPPCTSRPLPRAVWPPPRALPKSSGRTLQGGRQRAAPLLSDTLCSAPLREHVSVTQGAPRGVLRLRPCDTAAPGPLAPRASLREVSRAPRTEHAHERGRTRFDKQVWGAHARGAGSRPHTKLESPPAPH